MRLSSPFRTTFTFADPSLTHDNGSESNIVDPTVEEDTAKNSASEKRKVRLSLLTIIAKSIIAVLIILVTSSDWQACIIINRTQHHLVMVVPEV